MTDEEIVKRAKKAEKRTRFGELVYSPVSNGVNSAYGIGFIEGMVEYRNSLQEAPVNEELMEATCNYCLNVRKGYPRVMDETDRYICNAFKAGANWQKWQMMKGAIECYIRRNKCTKKNVLNGFDVTCDAVQKFKSGDKVKVIIIKED